MCKKHTLIFSAFFVFLILTYFKGKTQENKYKIRTVVIDAGHGGHDPGTNFGHIKEKNIALSIALFTGKYIEQNFSNVKVVYTRKTDVYVGFNKRAKIAHDNKADLFISIHVNGFASSSVYGTESYVLGLHKTEDNLRVAMLENSAILYEEDYKTVYKGFEPNNPESYIIFNLMQNQHLDNSLLLANFVENQFFERVKRYSRGVKQAGFYVLREVSMPSVLIETGFITNTKDRVFLLSKNGQELIASGIYRAFKKYKAEVEKRDITLQTVTFETEENTTADEPTKETVSSNTDDVFFCVQILSSQKRISLHSKKFKKLNDLQEYETGNTYKYLVGKTQNISEIIKLRTKLKKKFKDCFVVGFMNGERISFNEAKLIIERNK